MRISPFGLLSTKQAFIQTNWCKSEFRYVFNTFLSKFLGFSWTCNVQWREPKSVCMKMQQGWNGNLSLLFLSSKQPVLFKSFKFCLFVTVKLVFLSQDTIFINFCLVQVLKATLRWKKEWNVLIISSTNNGGFEQTIKKKKQR